MQNKKNAYNFINKKDKKEKETIFIKWFPLFEKKNKYFFIFSIKTSLPQNDNQLLKFL